MRNVFTLCSLGLLVSLASCGWVHKETAPSQSSSPQPLNSTKAVSSDTLKQVQSKLQENGFYMSSPVDGIWGPKTTAGVAGFQKLNNLTPTGNLDGPTLQMLGLTPNDSDS